MKKEKEKLTLTEEGKQSGDVSRRDFLVGAGTVVVGGAVGAGLLSSCSGGETKTVTTTKTVEKTVTTTVGGSGAVTITETTTVGGSGATVTETKTVTQPGSGGVEPWQEPVTTNVLPLAGNHRYITAVDSKNGKIVRIRPYHYTEQYSEADLAVSQWKYEAHGKTLECPKKTLQSYFQLGYKKRIYSPNRVRYPMKRVDWEPGGDSAKINPQNRGISKYKRISWDEATDIIAGEMVRIWEKYGDMAILNKSDSAHREMGTIHKNWGGGMHTPFMDRIGYTISQRNADSWEGHYWGAKHVWGSDAGDGKIQPNSNKEIEIAEHCEMLVITGGDWLTTSQSNGNFSTKYCRWLQDIGIKFVHIAPDLNYQNAAHPDKWIPIMSCQDETLAMAIIHTWITEDSYDKDYIASHSIGFDDYIKPYVMGETDGVVKSPAWASEWCGISEWTIKALAREWASKRTSWALGNGGPAIRGPYTHEWSRWMCVVMGMQGLGAPGRQQMDTPGGPPARPGFSPGAAQRGGGYGMADKPFQLFSKMLIHKAILEGKTEQWGSTSRARPTAEQFVKYEYPWPAEQGGGQFHMIYQDYACMCVCWNDGYKFLHAIRDPKIECYAIQAIWMENEATCADILLPITTAAETPDILTAGAEIPGLVMWDKCCEPIGESKSDYEAAIEIAKKLEEHGGRYAGSVEAVTGGKTVDEWLEFGFERSGAGDYISFNNLKQKKYVPAPINQDWPARARMMRPFYEDPGKNPLQTPSGKLEFYSARLAEHFPDDRERAPFPHHVVGGPPEEGWWHNENYKVSERAGKYPLVIVSNHPRWRVHNQYDDVTWFREIPTCKVKGPDGYLYEPIWLHPSDAAARGIQAGDICKMHNERGTTWGAAHVTERIIPGSVYQDHGARLDMLGFDDDDFAEREHKWVNRGGDNNVICPENGLSKNCTGMVSSGFLVAVEKLSGNEYEEMRRKYPEEFSRSYDSGAGLTVEAWLEGGK